MKFPEKNAWKAERKLSLIVQTWHFRGPLTLWTERERTPEIGGVDSYNYPHSLQQKVISTYGLFTLSF